MKKSEINKIFSHALDICEDFKPKAYNKIDEIQIIWFTPDQLKELIKYSVESGQPAIETR